MVRTRSQLENFSTEELIEELSSIEDISSKLSNLTSRFDDFSRRYETLSSKLSVSKNCNRLLSETIVQLEKNVRLTMLNIISVNYWRKTPFLDQVGIMFLKAAFAKHCP